MNDLSARQDEIQENDVIFNDDWNLKVAEEHEFKFKKEKVNYHLWTD